MKMTPTDLRDLDEAIRPYLTATAAGQYKRAGLSLTRFLWDSYWAALAHANGLRERLAVYQDSHIETALRILEKRYLSPAGLPLATEQGSMNELTLCIVNEGADYPERLATARLRTSRERFAAWSRRVAYEAHKQRLDFQADFTVAQMAQAVAELEDYYQRHLAEM